MPTRFDKRLLINFDWGLLGLTLLIGGLGVMNLRSAAASSHPDLEWTQAVWLALGLAVVFLTILIDYMLLERLALFFYLVVVGLLVLVLVKGAVISGSQRWLILGPLRLQPSELMQLALVVVLARFFHRDRTLGTYRLRELWLPFILIALPVVLIARQPDLGTAGLLALEAFALILFVRVRASGLATLAVGLLAVLPTAWIWLLKDYQKQRILTFLDPTGDALGAGYSANQSIIAVGSGGLWGKGFAQGTQTQLSFLPEQHTDFAFSVWAEEQGFVGCLLLLILYFFLIALAINVAAKAKERFGALLAVGIAGIIFWHVVINIGMVTGIFPVVGVPLPLLSYGGSSLLTTFIAIGLLINISMRRHIF